jgi:hypothetical protein
LPSCDVSFLLCGEVVVKSEAENIMQAEICELVMVVRVFTAMRNLLGDSGFVAAVHKWRRQHRRSS